MKIQNLSPLASRAVNSVMWFIPHLHKLWIMEVICVHQIMFLETTSLFSSFFFPIQFPSLYQQAFFFKDHDLSKLHVAECLPASRKANLRYFHNMLQGLSFPKLSL